MLERREELSDIGNVRRVQHQRAVLALLTLALLRQQVTAAVALHGEFARTSLANSFLSAAV